jgi:hypothetical protein
MSVKVSDIRKLIKDITEYAEKSYSITLRHSDNKDVISNWITALNTMIPDNTNNDNADNVVSDDQLIDEKYNSRYQSIVMYFSLAQVQDQSTMSYLGTTKSILELLKKILDKQIESNQFKDKQIEDKQIEAEHIEDKQIEAEQIEDNQLDVSNTK